MIVTFGLRSRKQWLSNKFVMRLFATYEFFDKMVSSNLMVNFCRMLLKDSTGLFETDYFWYSAFLSQSGQLYLES